MSRLDKLRLQGLLADFDRDCKKGTLESYQNQKLVCSPIEIEYAPNKMFVNDERFPFAVEFKDNYSKIHRNGWLANTIINYSVPAGHAIYDPRFVASLVKDDCLIRTAFGYRALLGISIYQYGSKQEIDFHISDGKIRKMVIRYYQTKRDRRIPFEALNVAYESIGVEQMPESEIEKRVGDGTKQEFTSEISF